MTSSLKRITFVKLSIFLLYFCSVTYGCPAICTCKWKGGKQTVECIDKGLSSLPSEIEHGTQVLTFSGNNIQSLHSHAFVSRNLINLQKINLANCNIGKIDEKAFVQVTNLVELDLSYNLITSIPVSAFKHIQALRHLNLAGNAIGSIPAHSFSHTPGLVYLDISNAKLRMVSPLAFQPLTQLETLQIQENNLKELPESVIASLQNSHGVKIHDNPWYCDCRALPLWRLLVVKRIPHIISPTCNAPRRISGTQFDDLKEEDFACPPKIRPVIRFIQGVAGENATVTCPVDGQPLPRVMWYIGDRPVTNGSILGLGPQRVYIVNAGKKDKVSYLVITGAQEADSGSIRCIAINPAGRATANFTLAVKMKAIVNEPLNSGHIAGISIGLIVLAVIILILTFLIFAKTRNSSSPTPGKNRSSTSAYAASPTEPNPIQKPPRLTDLSASTSTDPDLISEAERSARDNNYSNGYVGNGRIAPSVSEIGDYTRMDGDSLYPSSLWDSPAPMIHEHFNPGFVSQESPLHAHLHSTPLKSTQEPNFNPEIFGYPQDYGLPIPEIEEDSMFGARNMMHDTLSSELNSSNASRNELNQIHQNILSNLNSMKDSNMFPALNQSSSSLMRIQENKIAEDISMQDLEGTSAEEIPEVRHNPPPGERPWIPGSQDIAGVPLGVPVLPPLPNSSLHRLKARDSPDEGYQEGTEV